VGAGLQPNTGTRFQACFLGEDMMGRWIYRQPWWCH
jgi:hypothetical protein